jgi:hypothetical protein
VVNAPLENVNTNITTWGVTQIDAYGRLMVAPTAIGLWLRLQFKTVIDRVAAAHCLIPLRYLLLSLTAVIDDGC